jgi:cell division protease FtsH
VPQERGYSEGTAEAVDHAVRAFVDQAFALAMQVLQRNRALLDRTAAALLQTETLNEPEIEQLKHEILPEPASLPSPERPAAAAES